jgi:hypothetical protein
MFSEISIILILNLNYPGGKPPSRITGTVPAIGRPGSHHTYDLVESWYVLDMGMAVYL